VSRIKGGGGFSRAGWSGCLALDFDGVLCEGSREYFETSRRTYARLWPDAPRPGDECLQAFRALRPVIETGWGMPLLLRAIVQGEPGGASRRSGLASAPACSRRGTPRSR
jgi:hypothetical protein